MSSFKASDKREHIQMNALYPIGAAHKMLEALKSHGTPAVLATLKAYIGVPAQHGDLYLNGTDRISGNYIL